MNCKNCAKEMTCKKDQCNFISWKNTKNYGEVNEVNYGYTYVIKKTVRKNTY